MPKNIKPSFTHKVNADRVKKIVRELLLELGENPDREGLAGTPRRMADAYQFLTRGYSQNPQEILKKAVFKEDYNQMVVVRDVDFYSLCEHHLLPFYGKCHVGYIPRGKVIGLSKIPRVIEVFSRRLQVQERLTQEIASAIEAAVNPLGVGVVIEGFHLCMAMRGVEKQNAYAITSAMLGAFESHERTRHEFLNFIRHQTTQ